jgi:hypothetical protein
LRDEVDEFSEVAAEKKIRRGGSGKNLDQPHFAERVEGASFGHGVADLGLVKKIQATGELASRAL